MLWIFGKVWFCPIYCFYRTGWKSLPKNSLPLFLCVFSLSHSKWNNHYPINNSIWILAFATASETKKIFSTHFICTHTYLLQYFSIFSPHCALCLQFLKCSNFTNYIKMLCFSQGASSQSNICFSNYIHTYIHLLKKQFFRVLYYIRRSALSASSYEFFKVTLKKQHDASGPDTDGIETIKNVLKRGRAVLVKFTKWSRNRKSGHLFGLADASGMLWRYFDFCWTRRHIWHSGPNLYKYAHFINSDWVHL